MEGDYTEIVGEEESSGIFKVLQTKDSRDTILKMTLSYIKGDGDTIISDMSIDLSKMEFESKDHELHFISVEHLDSSQLKYFIKEQDTVFVRHGQEAYVQAKLVGIEDENQIGNGEGYVESEIFLYKVSESADQTKSNILHRRKKKKKKLEPSKKLLKFYLN